MEQQICGYGGIGRHKRLKISREQSRAGSSPATRTRLFSFGSFLPELFFLCRVTSHDCVCGLDLFAEIEMSICVCRGGDSAVP